MFDLDQRHLTDHDDEPRPTTDRAPGKSTLTSRLGASPSSIAHAVIERLRAGERDAPRAGRDGESGASSDGSTFLHETVTFSSGASGVSVGHGPVAVSTAGGTTGTHSVGFRVNLVVVAGGRPITPSPAQPVATATATATVPVPVRAAPPPPHTVFFAEERQPQGDEGALVAWAAGLPREAQDAIRDRRLSVTVIGYTSTTGDDQTNMKQYSRQRAQWVQRVLAAALAVDAGAIHVGHLGEYTAPAEDRAAPHGVANPSQRRVEITFAETAPTTTASATASATATTPP